jgi:hypothetical protein
MPRNLFRARQFKEERAMKIAMAMLVGLTALLVLGVGARPAPADETQESFAWFDGLGFPDLARCKFIRVATGQSYQERGQPPKKSFLPAFLIKDDGPRFTVFTTTLETQTYTKTAPDKPDHERVGYDARDLRQEATGLLKSLRRPGEEDDFLRRFGARLSERAELFVWARACAAQGHAQLARELLAEAPGVPPLRGRAAEPFFQAIAADVAHAQMWRAVEAFGDPAVPRKELLVRFTWIARHFPKSRYAEEARQTAALLETMVAEDEAHARKPVKPAQALTRPERIAELIFRLRDQNGGQLSQPGSCDIFINDRLGDPKAEKSPAQKLVDIGYDAVPQLLAAIEDERFTRSVGFHRNFYFSHFVLRVGDCAAVILEQIAGRSFWEPRTTSAAMLKDGHGPAVKQRAQAWWQEYQQLGERGALLVGTEAGDENSPAQAERLVEKYPDNALDAILMGLHHCKQDWHRKRLVEIAARLPGEVPAAFLRRELRGSMVGARVAAARGLLERGRDEGVKAMIKEWTQGGPAEGVEDLIAFLLWCGKPEAVRALARNWQDQPVGLRGEIVSQVFSRGLEGEKYRQPVPAAVQEAIDGLLVAALEDTGRWINWSASWNDKTFSNPRICDLSGFVLARRWNQPAAFDPEGPIQDRNRQRVELKNAWLKQQGKEPGPIPGKVERPPDR